MRKALAIAVFACTALLAASAQDAAAQEKKVRLNMGGALPSSMAMLGPAQLYFADRVKKLSGGSLEIKFFEPGALVPASQYFDAVSSGNLDAAFTGLGFFTGKDVALALYSSVPFGPETSLRWPF
jgi:TRAP-type mannitol/chloroaromatic compound transport system substrate-binding protein